MLRALFADLLDGFAFAVALWAHLARERQEHREYERAKREYFARRDEWGD